jgi:Arc/MetJ family transcription regulator
MDRGHIMKTRIDIDGDVLSAVQELGGFATKREAVNTALAELARKLAARQLLGMRCPKLQLEGDLELQRRSRFPGWDEGR